MALTPEQIAEIQRLKALMQPAANEAQRKAQAIWNAEQMANRNQPPGKKNGGLEKFLEPSVVKERMYHGTSHYASTPEKTDKLTSTGIKGFKKKSRGTFLSPDADLAEYTNTQGGVHGAVYPVHVQVQNPFDFDNLEHINALAAQTKLEPEAVRHLLFRDTDNWQTLEEPWMQKAIKQLGHDAYYTLEDGRKNLAVYDPRKIKSAIGNRGTYDTNKRDITKANGGQVNQDVMRLALMNKGGKPPQVTKVTKKADDRIPELEEAARALLAEEITRTAYDKILKQLKPVRPYTSVPAPATDEEALNALMENKRKAWKSNQFEAGDPVGMRLDIPAYQQHGVWVNSLHDEGGRKLPTSYAPVSSVRNAVFDAKPSQAQRVAVGETNKSPFAKIKGEWHPIDEAEALAQMQEYLDHPEWHQVGMDPRRRDYFYSRKDSRKPVTHAEHVLQIGPLVLAKNPTFGKRKDFGLKDGGEVTHAHHLEIEERPL